MDQQTSRGFNSEFWETREPQGPEISPLILGEMEALQVQGKETQGGEANNLRLDCGYGCTTP